MIFKIGHLVFLIEAYPPQYSRRITHGYIYIDVFSLFLSIFPPKKKHAKERQEIEDCSLSKWMHFELLIFQKDSLKQTKPSQALC